ncbi:MAG: hypothetical protein HQL81_11340 [Magnetococcales bacterium]|nr:hypothetical protein [Magnetococcales bacterium]
MPPITAIGSAPWTRDELVAALPEFAELYQHRPIPENRGGMGAPHMFAIWFILKKLQPRVIIESGVWLGQGTWFFERACPHAQLHCIDINLERIRYRSKKAIYHDRDFSRIDWTALPRRETLLFFDDHQSAHERVKTAHWFGFSHLVFEDNYPPGQGDCYSLKHVLAHSGFKRNFGRPKGIKGRIGQGLAKIRESLHPSAGVIAPNSHDAAYFLEQVAVYQELPPVFKLLTTRWGGRWDDPAVGTPPPLLEAVRYPWQQVYLDEAGSYTWLCYLQLRHG